MKFGGNGRRWISLATLTAFILSLPGLPAWGQLEAASERPVEAIPPLAPIGGIAWDVSGLALAAPAIGQAPLLAPPAAAPRPPTIAAPRLAAPARRVAQERAQDRKALGPAAGLRLAARAGRALSRALLRRALPTTRAAAAARMGFDTAARRRSVDAETVLAGGQGDAPASGLSKPEGRHPSSARGLLPTLRRAAARAPVRRAAVFALAFGLSWLMSHLGLLTDPASHAVQLAGMLPLVPGGADDAEPAPDARELSMKILEECQLWLDETADEFDPSEGAVEDLTEHHAVDKSADGGGSAPSREEIEEYRAIVDARKELSGGKPASANVLIELGTNALWDWREVRQFLTGFVEEGTLALVRKAEPERAGDGDEYAAIRLPKRFPPKQREKIIAAARLLSRGQSAPEEESLLLLARAAAGLDQARIENHGADAETRALLRSLELNALVGMARAALRQAALNARKLGREDEEGRALDLLEELQDVRFDGARWTPAAPTRNVLDGIRGEMLLMRGNPPEFESRLLDAESRAGLDLFDAFLENRRPDYEGGTLLDPAQTRDARRGLTPAEAKAALIPFSGGWSVYVTLWRPDGPWTGLGELSEYLDLKQVEQSRDKTARALELLRAPTRDGLGAAVKLLDDALARLNAAERARGVGRVAALRRELKALRRGALLDLGRALALRQGNFRARRVFSRLRREAGGTLADGDKESLRALKRALDEPEARRRGRKENPARAEGLEALGRFLEALAGPAPRRRTAKAAPADPKNIAYLELLRRRHPGASVFSREEALALGRSGGWDDERTQAALAALSRGGYLLPLPGSRHLLAADAARFDPDAARAVRGMQNGKILELWTFPAVLNRALLKASRRNASGDVLAQLQALRGNAVLRPARWYAGEAKRLAETQEPRDRRQAERLNKSLDSLYYDGEGLHGSISREDAEELLRRLPPPKPAQSKDAAKNATREYGRDALRSFLTLAPLMTREAAAEPREFQFDFPSRLEIERYAGLLEPGEVFAETELASIGREAGLDGVQAAFAVEILTREGRLARLFNERHLASGLGPADRGAPDEAARDAMKLMSAARRSADPVSSLAAAAAKLSRQRPANPDGEWEFEAVRQNLMLELARALLRREILNAGAQPRAERLRALNASLLESDYSRPGGWTGPWDKETLRFVRRLARRYREWPSLSKWSFLAPETEEGLEALEAFCAALLPSDAINETGAIAPLGRLEAAPRPMEEKFPAFPRMESFSPRRHVLHSIETQDSLWRRDPALFEARLAASRALTLLRWGGVENLARALASFRAADAIVNRRLASPDGEAAAALSRELEALQSNAHLRLARALLSWRIRALRRLRKKAGKEDATDAPEIVASRKALAGVHVLSSGQGWTLTRELNGTDLRGLRELPEIVKLYAASRGAAASDRSVQTGLRLFVEFFEDFPSARPAPPSTPDDEKADARVSTQRLKKRYKRGDDRAPKRLEQLELPQTGETIHNEVRTRLMPRALPRRPDGELRLN